jgi:hypothetical protein
MLAAQHQLATVILITSFSLFAIQFLTDESGLALADSGAAFGIAHRPSCLGRTF